jgi:glycosyltransferase involved in cell wall biosynthesis
MCPDISIVMPVWNGEAYLEEAVKSVLAQTFRDFEFLIIDDGSTDRTPEILAKYQSNDSRIRVLRLEHSGIVSALNRGISEARAEWIARMDSDDISHPTRLEKQWKQIKENPRAVLCHCHRTIIGDPSLVTPAGYFIRTQALLALRLCFHCPIVHPTVLFRKETFLECGAYDESEQHAEDYGLWGRMLTKGEVTGVAEPLLDFRVHGGSISKRKLSAQLALSEKIAIQHCATFMNLDPVRARRAYYVFRGDLCQHPAHDWVWFLFRCLPRMRWQSLEMWVWVLRNTPKFLSRPSASTSRLDVF